MVTLRKILVATDFSPCSDVALRYARELTQAFGARLFVLHALDISPVELVSTEAFLPGHLRPEVRFEIEGEARASLERSVTADDRQSLHAVTVFRDGPEPADAVVRFAADEGVDLIVLGTHGRRGLPHLLMGSVAEKVVRTAPCPVLTVGAHERHDHDSEVPEPSAVPTSASS